MSSIEWIADMLFYAMRTYLKMTAPSCDAHFLINALGKVSKWKPFIICEGLNIIPQTCRLNILYISLNFPL